MALDVRVISNMQWSKLKARVKDFICPELRDRIDFHLTSYRESHDGADKVWITVDGKRVFSCKHYPYEWAEAEAYHGRLRGEQVRELLCEKEIQRPKDFGDAMRAYLDMAITEAVKSSDPLVKAFAVVDRRLGKRTLAKLEISDSEHTLVRVFYELRVASAHI
ncbi:MAG: hypothetical protein LC754_06700 [Acidobacteria bacterium]|nr:hypothetical protein [Acidobacteriota bacterium]